MSLFARNNAIALTWTPQTCHAVRLSVNGAACKVDVAWAGQVGKEGDSLAELLVNAIKAVGGDDTIYIVAGGNGQGWGMADLAMPATLKSEELRNALAFELRKQTPLPLDKLHWGYRALPKSAAAGAQQQIRIFYVKSDHWNSWLKAADGLKHLDAMLPAPVSLDPVLAGQSLIMPGGPGTPGRYEYRPTPSGRQIIPIPETDPLTLAQSFPFKDCALGDIAKLDLEAQLAFTPALTLGIYGLTESVSGDAKTLVPLPERFTAHRNIAAKAIACCIGVYVLGLIVYALAASLSAKVNQIRKIDAAIAQTKKELADYNKLLDPKDTERATLLRQELTDNTPNAPDFPTALLAITQNIDASDWISQSLEWKQGQISFQIQGPNKDLELANRLEASPYLGDVTERLSTYNQPTNSYTQRFELNARYDTQEEAEALKIQQAKAAEKAAAQKAADEKAAAEAAAHPKTGKNAAEEEAPAQTEEASEGEEPGDNGEGNAVPAAPKTPAPPPAAPGAGRPQNGNGTPGRGGRGSAPQPPAMPEAAPDQSAE